MDSCECHEMAGLLLLGYSNGVFGLYSLKGNEVDKLQIFDVATEGISSMTLAPDGEWIALACKESGHLMVWEWKTQTFVLNQKSENASINCVSFSRDGKMIATGGFDGKIRLWDTSSFFCVSSFDNHSAKITGVKFSKKKPNTLISSSLDGTVRAFDTKKYTCFRTMEPESHNQLICLEDDSSGDIIFAGGYDPYAVYCWNLQTGNLIDVLSG